MQSLVMLFLVKPIAGITEISLHYSYKLPVIKLLKLKKQIYIVIATTILKMISSVPSDHNKKIMIIQSFICYELSRRFW